MHYLFCIVLLVSCCLLGGCREDMGPEPMGAIHLTLTDKVETKAMPDALSPQLTDQFMVTMISIAEKKLVFGGTCAAFNAKAQLFKSGEYTIEASFGANPALAMDAPFYTSEKDTVTVEAGKGQTVALRCSVGNALASFELMNKDKLDKVLKDYYVEVVVSGQSVKWYPGNVENPYFKAGSEVIFYLKGIWIENNQPYSKKIANLLPAVSGKRYNYKLKFDTSNMTGAILDIQVDASVETVTVNQILPPNWLPKPKITAKGFDENNLMIYTETEDARTAMISYAAVRPVEDVEMTLEFADPNLLHLNKTYFFSALAESDRTALLAANILLPAVDGVSTYGSINLTDLTPSLWTKAGGVEAENVVKLRVKANDRWSDEANFTIKTVKPLFNMGVYPGNIWTKEFTANPLVADSVKNGNYNRFTDITYEFSTDGSNWEPLTASLHKEGLTPGTAYYVRPKYRGEVPGESTCITLEDRQTIPNSDMETWYDYKLGTGPHNIPFYELNVADEPDKWWATNNARSTVYRQAALVYQSTTYPTVSKTKVANSGTYAAEIRTIGGSSTNISSSASGYIPGLLFIGSYAYSGSNRLWDGTETITKGHIFTSKPTKLTFMYQYTAYNSGEQFTCEVELRNQSMVLGKGSFKGGSQSGYTMATVNIDYKNMDVSLPVDNIYVIFSSTDSPTGKWVKNLTLEGYGSNWAAWLGSILKIDDISLLYEK